MLICGRAIEQTMIHPLYREYYAAIKRNEKGQHIVISRICFCIKKQSVKIYLEYGTLQVKMKKTEEIKHISAHWAKSNMARIN